MFIPALAGYIAYAIADRPGIAPGFVMGGLAADVMQFGTPQTGFLGAIVGGVLAGVDRPLDRRLEGADLGARPDAGAGDPAAHLVIAGFLMIVVFGKPIGWLMTQLTDGLNNMSGSNACCSA